MSFSLFGDVHEGGREGGEGPVWRWRRGGRIQAVHGEGVWWRLLFPEKQVADEFSWTGWLVDWIGY